MKRTFYTMLLATALALPASYASAQIGVSTSTGVNVGSSNVGVSSNTGVSANSTTGAGTSATMNSGTNDTTRLNYNNDVNLRANRDQNAVNSNASSRSRVNSSAGIASSARASAYSSSDLDAASVRNIQQSLNDRGYNVGRVDGKWNSSTAAQLQKFENSQGLTASSSTSLNARSLNQLGVNIGAAADVNSINPSSGSQIITPSVRSGVTGSASYNQ